MKPLNRPLLILIVLILAIPALANTVTFDLEPLGTVYGAPAGHVPGDFMFTEDLADLYVDEFFSGGTPYFNYCRIEGPLLGFGSVHTLQVNNVGVTIGFNGAGDATFEFLDLGGTVNIQVNGHGAVIEAPDFPSLGTFIIAPGVVMSSTYTSVGGGIMGQVTLTGPVEKVRIGGQELWIDNVRCDNGGGGDPCDHEVTYEPWPAGGSYGAPAGDLPGDIVHVEDGIPVSVEEFDAGSMLLFNEMKIDPAFGPFGSTQVMQINNIGQMFHIGSLGLVTTEVTFEYVDLGGTENLQINGSPLMVGDLDTWHGMTLGGVLVEVATSPYGGGLYGQVRLTGDVHTLRVGGQEFWMDDLCVIGGGGGCDFLVDHSSLNVGDLWGNPVGTPPGTLIFTEDSVPVYIGRLDAGSVYTYNYCEVWTSFNGVGAGNIMNLNNVTNTYDIAATGIGTTSSVSFVFMDLGGTENLQVNGATLYVGDLHLAPANIAPGVTFSVNTWAVPGGLAGDVTLTGNVQRLTVGGQEFFIDDVCIDGGSGTVSWCDHLSDIESPPLGAGWGGSFGNVPGDIMFTEDGMTAFCETFTDVDGNVIFGDARVDLAFPAFGDGQILTIANLGVGYDLSALGATEQVRIQYFDGAGVENLRVNGGPLYVGELDAVPTAIAPGVTATVYETAGPGYATGTLVLEGLVNWFIIGGQQFAIDNVCVRLVGSLTDADPLPAPTAAVSLLPNAPNPFNPATTLKFNLAVAGHVKLSIHDTRGRLVRTLVDEARGAGRNEVLWNGRDDRGRSVAAGIYLVQVQSAGGVDKQKIALIK